MISVCLVALSLALDATAAAICCGVSNDDFSFRDGLRLGLWFGSFQGGMTALGGLAGTLLSRQFTLAGAVAAFGILLYLGGAMLLNALSPTKEVRTTPYRLDTPSVLLLAIATSLDALAVGVSIAFLKVELWTAVLVIGGTAFILSTAGSLLGRCIGERCQRWASIVGGLVLMGIGVKILLEKIYFSV